MLAASVALSGTGAALAQAPSPAVKEGGLTLSGFVQVDWVVHRQSSQDELDPATREPLNEDRFLLRRGRLRAEGWSGYFGARLVLDANTVRTVTVRPFEAALLARYPADIDPEALSPAALPRQVKGPSDDLSASVSAGLRPIPFGFDAVESDLSRPLLERATFSRAFFGQARDLGIGADLAYRIARLSVAVQNGQPLSEDRYAGRDLTRAKDLVARAGVSVSLGAGAWLQAGVSCLLGQGLHPGTAATKDALAWVDGNEDGLISVTELTPIPGAPASPSATFQRSALGADARVGWLVPRLGELTLRAELVRAVNLDREVVPADPVAAGRSLRELGAYVAVSQELTRYGLVAARYELYDPDADARRRQAAAVVPSDQTFRTFSLALAGRWESTRVVAQVDIRDNALGRSVSGAPTRLRDDAVTLRFEGRFR